MFILQATDIEKQYGTRTVLKFDGMQVYEGDRIGIVGLNGAGKSTLMGILSGEIAPDSGKVDRRCEVSFIRQMPTQEGTLSGGENAKRQIQRELHREGTIVFADEPTANLDAAGVRWVREKLLAAPTVLLISHDRELLDAVCNRIVEVRDGGLFFYTGSYADYERRAAQEKARREQDYEKYRQKKAQLEEAVQVRERKLAHQRQLKRRQMAKNSSEARLGGHKRAASMKKQEHIAKVLEARVDRLEKVERIKEPPKIHLDFSLTAPPGNKLVIRCEGLDFAYGEHRIFAGASFAVKNGAKVAVTGDNGVGKSTLLRLIAQGHPAIACAPKLRPGVLHQDFGNLDPERTVLDNAMDTAVQDQATVRGVLAGLLFRRDDVYKKVGVLSGGEKMRLSIAKLVVGASNALFLDEPTNYLDIRSLEAVERVLREYPGTLLLISHDRRFTGAVAGKELNIQGGKVVAVQARVERAPDAAAKTLLEMRRIRLLGEISSAPAERKGQLEQELAGVVETLRGM